VLHERATQLYALISSGCDSLAFSVGAGGPMLICIDIDAHRRPGECELEARQRARRTLGRVLAAFGCSATRHPLILRSPGGGYHVWLPLTREGMSANAEHTWPTRIVRRWFQRHLDGAGLDLASGGRG
jgi:hypothetical protein